MVHTPALFFELVLFTFVRCDDGDDGDGGDEYSIVEAVRLKALCGLLVLKK